MIITTNLWNVAAPHRTRPGHTGTCIIISWIEWEDAQVDGVSQSQASTLSKVANRGYTYKTSHFNFNFQLCRVYLHIQFPRCLIFASCVCVCRFVLRISSHHRRDMWVWINDFQFNWYCQHDYVPSGRKTELFCFSLFCFLFSAKPKVGSGGRGNNMVGRVAKNGLMAWTGLNKIQFDAQCTQVLTKRFHRFEYGEKNGWGRPEIHFRRSF